MLNLKSKTGDRRLHTLGFYLLLVVLAAATASACDGDDNDSRPSATADASGSTPIATAPSNANSLERLAALYAAGPNGKIVYSVSSENYGTHPNGKLSTYRLDTAVREDWTSSELGFEQTAIGIKTGDSLTLCSKTEFTEDCHPVQNEEGFGIVFAVFTPVREVPLALLSDELDYEYTELPDEEIAGATGRCFDVQVNERIGAGPSGTEEIKLCFTEDGELLSLDRVFGFEIEGLPGARFTAVAEETSEAVPADFQPIVSPR